jgi:hypothetical protein
LKKEEDRRQHTEYSREQEEEKSSQPSVTKGRQGGFESKKHRIEKNLWATEFFSFRAMRPA